MHFLQLLKHCLLFISLGPELTTLLLSAGVRMVATVSQFPSSATRPPFCFYTPLLSQERAHCICPAAGDIKNLTRGAKIYFPVFVEGAAPVQAPLTACHLGALCLC